jgi:proteasome activator subunit 4
MFGDVTSSEGPEADGVEVAPYANGQIALGDGIEDTVEPELSNDMEDALLRDSTGGFASWVANFIRRVIQLLENLPEEGANCTAGGTTEGILTSLDVSVDLKS